MKKFNITDIAKEEFTKLENTDNIGIIYEHVNLVTKEKYIGQTIFWNDPYKRWGVNGSNYLRKDSNRSTKFSNAIKNYGWDGFEHNIITYCNIEDLDLFEDMFIKENNSIENGYNEIDNGRGMSNELRMSISKNRKGKCVGADNPQWGKTVNDETRKRMSASHTGKRDSIETRMKKSKAQMGHKVSEKQIEFIRNLNKGKIGGTYRAFGSDNPASKKVGLFLGNDIVKIFESVSEAAIFSGLSKSPYIISEYCSNKREFNAKYLDDNLNWRFIEEDIVITRIVDINSIKKILNNIYSKKKIVMYSLNDEFIKEFETSRDAADYVNSKFTSHILGCCNGNRNSAYGYKWRYKDDDSNR